MRRYHRENPDQPSRHDWFEGAITGKTPEEPRRYLCEGSGKLGVIPEPCNTRCCFHDERKQRCLLRDLHDGECLFQD